MATWPRYPCSCDTFVALPQSTVGERVIFGKNSDRPCDEVQEVVYFPAKKYESGAQLECTYIKIDQVPETYAVVLSRPAWLWGAEMGANEHQVCIGNEAVWGREEASDAEALLGMDLVRLGLERADTAEKALDVIVDLLEKYGQGGNCMEDECTFTYHNSFLIADRTVAWVLETSGKHWAAEKITGSITAESMMGILRDKDSGINMEGAFLTTGSMVSVLPRDPSLPGVHYFTGTPDPERSVFKPFIFVKNIQQLQKTSSPRYGPEDPVKKQPRFQSKPDRKHILYKKHEVAAKIIKTTKEKGAEMMKKMRQLEKEKIAEMEKFLQCGIEDSTLVVHLFADTVEEELKAYS
ncbi:secernin-3 isoform X2 [Lepisosteus oculatus]|uniref:secernin-3 isoform X2 n=1 Tax=Lepisosteus oculatus TaxID=7918 RepID=UPI00073FF8D9|nr:PREDICTED: secernin-3 isoform X2 [Lepisosteus oculatus]